jgi:hypothetical protein
MTAIENAQRSANRRRRDREREERLAQIAADVEAGTLVVRQATDAEREAWRRERDEPTEED